MIQKFADWLVFNLIGLDASTRFAIALNFFVFETIKVLILLFVISAIMGIINAYFPIDRLKNYLQTHKLYGLQYLLASFFGAITPFCSCSSIPLFVGFVKGGVPLGVTFSFLITSPLVNEVAVAMFLGAFGLKTTIIYVVSGIIFGTLGGIILGQFKLERHLSPWVLQIQKDSIEQTGKWEAEHISFRGRLPGIIKESWGIVKGVLIYVLIGIGIGSAIHGFVPEGFFTKYLSAEQWWTVPTAVLIGIPMYSNAAGIVPVIEVFVRKGVAIGTAIAFMMGIVGLSLPEMTMLKKVMNWKLIGIFFGTIAVMFILSGWLFNAVL